MSDQFLAAEAAHHIGTAVWGYTFLLPEVLMGVEGQEERRQRDQQKFEKRLTLNL